MNVREFSQALEANQPKTLRFALPSGQLVPVHFHVTEVGRVDRTFIDCGGTRRSTSSCLIQIWHADDAEHRLQPAKLAKIMQMAKPILESDELPVEVEFGDTIAAQYAVDHFESVFGTVTFGLVGKRTDCLAKDKCGVDGCGSEGAQCATAASTGNVAGEACCGTGTTCCA